MSEVEGTNATTKKPKTRMSWEELIEEEVEESETSFDFDFDFLSLLSKPKESQSAYKGSPSSCLYVPQPSATQSLAIKNPSRRDLPRMKAD
ncbi:hypothetical protein QJS10_CPA06g02144 [Acorus calamus]|uniref:Uncharacterized protein n=1 Tax=Acorus calamus TaxID=4465 RepID=A0AAV9EQA2_ACOCL|nr:hypothetical protein QJS10_CPA06g02144 [Acorus calamus]